MAASKSSSDATTVINAEGCVRLSHINFMVPASILILTLTLHLCVTPEGNVNNGFIARMVRHD
jgi:hypothetical protein